MRNLRKIASVRRIQRTVKLITQRTNENTLIYAPNDEKFWRFCNWESRKKGKFIDRTGTRTTRFEWI